MSYARQIRRKCRKKLPQRAWILCFVRSERNCRLIKTSTRALTRLWLTWLRSVSMKLAVKTCLSITTFWSRCTLRLQFPLGRMSRLLQRQTSPRSRSRTFLITTLPSAPTTHLLRRLDEDWNAHRCSPSHKNWWWSRFQCNHLLSAQKHTKCSVMLETQICSCLATTN